MKFLWFFVISLVLLGLGVSAITSSAIGMASLMDPSNDLSSTKLLEPKIFPEVTGKESSSSPTKSPPNLSDTWSEKQQHRNPRGNEASDTSNAVGRSASNSVAVKMKSRKETWSSTGAGAGAGMGKRTVAAHGNAEAKASVIAEAKASVIAEAKASVIAEAKANVNAASAVTKASLDSRDDDDGFVSRLTVEPALSGSDDATQFPQNQTQLFRGRNHNPDVPKSENYIIGEGFPKGGSLIGDKGSKLHGKESQAENADEREENVEAEKYGKERDGGNGEGEDHEPGGEGSQGDEGYDDADAENESNEETSLTGNKHSQDQSLAWNDSNNATIPNSSNSTLHLDPATKLSDHLATLLANSSANGSLTESPPSLAELKPNTSAPGKKLILQIGRPENRRSSAIASRHGDEQSQYTNTTNEPLEETSLTGSRFHQDENAPRVNGMNGINGTPPVTHLKPALDMEYTARYHPKHPQNSLFVNSSTGGGGSLMETLSSLMELNQNASAPERSIVSEGGQLENERDFDPDESQTDESGRETDMESESIEESSLTGSKFHQTERSQENETGRNDSHRATVSLALESSLGSTRDPYSPPSFLLNSSANESVTGALPATTDFEQNTNPQDQKNHTNELGQRMDFDSDPFDEGRRSFDLDPKAGVKKAKDRESALGVNSSKTDLQPNRGYPGAKITGENYRQNEREPSEGRRMLSNVTQRLDKKTLSIPALPALLSERGRSSRVMDDRAWSKLNLTRFPGNESETNVTRETLELKDNPPETIKEDGEEADDERDTEEADVSRGGGNETRKADLDTPENEKSELDEGEEGTSVGSRNSKHGSSDEDENSIKATEALPRQEVNAESEDAEDDEDAVEESPERLESNNGKVEAPDGRKPAKNGGDEATTKKTTAAVRKMEAFPQDKPEEVDISQLPYLAISVTKLNRTVEKQVRCGGAILSEWHVLSAAHCYFDRDEVVIPSRVTIVTAQTGWDISKLNAHAQLRSGESISVYPGYVPLQNDSTTHDLAVVKVRKPFVFNELCKPISLRTTPVPMQEALTCITPGWTFADSKSQPFAEHHLARMKLTVGLGSTCPCLHWLHPEGLMCSVRDTAYSICDGDLGGPLVCSGKLVGLAQGLTSANCSEVLKINEGACAGQKLTVYIYLCPYLGWLSGYVSELRELEDFPCDEPAEAAAATLHTARLIPLALSLLSLARLPFQ